MRHTVAAVALLVALVAAQGAHATPLEDRLSQAASQIAGRQVAVSCPAQSDWDSLTAFLGQANDLGVVPHAVDATGATVMPVTAFLSPATCATLEIFADAAVKPTLCQATVAKTTRTYVTVKRRIKGKLVSKRVARVRTTRTLGPHVPCYANGYAVAGDGAFWTAYAKYAEALLTVAHESEHLAGYVTYPLPNGGGNDPNAEADATCRGMQQITTVARALGDTGTDGDAIAAYWRTYRYPQLQGTTYWSADCQP
jgi:hypothetical protein